MEPSMAGVKMLLVRGNVHDNKRGVGGSACDRIHRIFKAEIKAERLQEKCLQAGWKQRKAWMRNETIHPQKAHRAPTLMLPSEHFYLCIFTGAPLASHQPRGGKWSIKNTRNVC